MIVPFRDFVVVMKEDAETKSAGGIFIGTVEEKISRGKVVAVGSGRVTTDGKSVPLEIKVDDRVIFNKNLATEIKDGDKNYLLLREDQVWGKLV